MCECVVCYKSPALKRSYREKTNISLSNLSLPAAQDKKYIIIIIIIIIIFRSIMYVVWLL